LLVLPAHFGGLPELLARIEYPLLSYVDVLYSGIPMSCFWLSFLLILVSISVT
jgi:hypothetical protein